MQKQVIMFMTKFLIAILLLLAAFKLIADNRAFVNKYDLAKCTEQEGEEKQEVNEHGKGKYNTEDHFYFYSSLNPSVPYALKTSSKTNLQQDTYIGFVGKPNTPPPDRL